MKYQLRLYVIGQTPNSMRALQNLKRICEEDLVGQYDLKVIDVLKEPQLAEKDKIIATPTLVKDLPAPLRKVIGDLSDRDKVLLGLDVVGANRKNNVGPEPVTASEEAN
ncbi:MAG: circadian clock protein KaiB [Planctomycetes bacterium]|nr:circadian clock protein KaiB [Planctomycetota bacterium]